MSFHKTLALCLGLAAGIVYLAAHALVGRQGLVAHWALQAEERALQAEHEALRAQSRALHARVGRMRAASLDRDYLDERARLLLGAAAPGEITFVRFAGMEGL